VSIAPDGSAYAIPSPAELLDVDLSAPSDRPVVIVQGLGFVGAAVAAVLSGAEDELGRPLYSVIGVDLATPESYWKIGKINAGASPFSSPDRELEDLIRRGVLEGRNLVATASESAYQLADVIILDIPLDVRERVVGSANEIHVELNGFEEALRAIGKRMKPDALVVIETTVPIGTTERIAAPILREERARRGIQAPLLLAHAYERIMPGPKYVESVREYFRSFAGIDEASTDRTRAFLDSFIDTERWPLWVLTDTTSSEMAKLLENSYRAANIAFVYEWTLLAEQVGVNLFDVIDSIRVRRGTHDNMRYPGFGVGGYCLTKDSYLAQWGALHLFSSNVALDMTLAALRVNYHMPRHTFDLLSELAGGSLDGMRVAVFGVSYLAGVADTRNSPTEMLVDELERAGARIVAHDPCVAHWEERPEVHLAATSGSALAAADAAVLAVPHPEYAGLSVSEITSGGTRSLIIVDAQNVLDDEKAGELHSAGCRIAGVGKGHWREKGFHL